MLNVRPLILLTLIFFLLAVGVASADYFPASRTRVPSARSGALGGRHAALADDLDSLFSNPAGFATAQEQLRIAELTLALRGPVFTIAGIVVEGMEGDFDEVLATDRVGDLVRNLDAGVNLAGPLSFGYVGNGVGFGVFNESDVVMRNEGLTTIRFAVRERMIVAGGLGLQVPTGDALPGRLDAGFVLKGFIEGETGFAESLIELPDTISGAGPGLLLEDPFYLTSGIGADIGLLYAPIERLSFGLAAMNVYTPAVQYRYVDVGAFTDNDAPEDRETLMVPLELSAGVLYRPPLAFLERHVSDLKLMFDYRDAVDFLVQPENSENVLLKFSAGAELTLLRILALRAGFARGLPSVGLGVDFGKLRVDAAMFGTELSSEPGLRSVYNILLG
ncbi:MAG: hypothetical protein ABR590_10085, partial [Spirochaetia bacterium]